VVFSVKSMSAKNTVDPVRMEMIAKMPILIQPSPEQRRIASILSGVDAGTCLSADVHNGSRAGQPPIKAAGPARYAAGLYREIYACPFWFSVIFMAWVFMIVSPTL